LTLNNSGAFAVSEAGLSSLFGAAAGFGAAGFGAAVCALTRATAPMRTIEEQRIKRCMVFS
jgi:hypothetical protein